MAERYRSLEEIQEEQKRIDKAVGEMRAAWVYGAMIVGAILTAYQLGKSPTELELSWDSMLWSAFEIIGSGFGVAMLARIGAAVIMMLIEKNISKIGGFAVAICCVAVCVFIYADAFGGDFGEYGLCELCGEKKEISELKPNNGFCEDCTDAYAVDKCEICERYYEELADGKCAYCLNKCIERIDEYVEENKLEWAIIVEDFMWR